MDNCHYSEIIRLWLTGYKPHFQQIEAVNFMGKPCYKILAELPAAECTKGFIGWLPILSSCSKKCNNDECCLSNCVFQENGLLVEGSLNKTKLASWISRTGNAEDLRVMAYIDHCETIGINWYLKLLKRSNTQLFCFSQKSFTRWTFMWNTG